MAQTTKLTTKKHTPTTATSSLAFDERGRSIAWMTRTVHRLYNVNVQNILNREGVTITHWYCLRILSARGTMTQVELSKRVGIASTTTVYALDALEQRGLLCRSRDENDRRKYFVSLTDEGRRLIDSLMPSITTAMNDSVRHIPESEMKIFWSVGQKIIAKLEAEVGSDTVLD